MQTESIITRLHQSWPNLEVVVEHIHTTGDRVTDVPLSRIGGDGVFVTEIERALRERRIDLAVHSLKDLPTAIPAGLHLVVPGPREDVRDVFVSNEAFEITNGTLVPIVPYAHLTPSMRVGTGSLRRTAQIRALCPDVEILPLRGNVDTRLRKLEAGNYDGIILASAGLHRLDIRERLAGRMTYFPVDLLLPAPGQGALGLETRDEPELRTLLVPLDDVKVHAETAAERMFMRRLGAGCYLPVAAYGEIVAGMLTLRGLVISLDGRQEVRVQQSIPWTAETNVEYAEALGISVAEQALIQGADAIIQSIDSSREQERERV